MPIEDMSLLYLARTPPRRSEILRIHPTPRNNDFITARAASEIRHALALARRACQVGAATGWRFQLRPLRLVDSRRGGLYPNAGACIAT
jgi:hypothetical protein